MNIKYLNIFVYPQIDLGSADRENKYPRKKSTVISIIISRRAEGPVREI